MREKDIELKDFQAINIERKDNKKLKIFTCISFFCKKHQSEQSEKKKLISNETMVNYQSLPKPHSTTLQEQYNQLMNTDTTSIDIHNYNNGDNIKLLKAFALKNFSERKKAILTFNGSVNYFKKLLRNTFIATQQIEIPNAAKKLDVSFTREEPEKVCCGMTCSLISFAALITFLAGVAIGYGNAATDNNTNYKKGDINLGHVCLIGTIVSFVLLIFFLSFIFKTEEIPLLMFNSISNCRKNYEYNTTFKIDPPDFELGEKDIEKCEQNDFRK